LSKIEVDTIDKQSGSTLTLGGSGTAVTLASGATQTGFGPTGSASWVTTVKTGDFTAVAGEGYFVNTTSGEIDVTLPAGTAGAVVAVADYANTADTNNIILKQNGSDKIEGSTNDFVINQEGVSITLVFVDSTKGWITTDTGNSSNAYVSNFIVATGGTITTVCTNFKVHTFTGPGTFTVSETGSPVGSNSLEYIVVAGGGATPGFNYNNSPAGGGGGGGFRFASPTLAPATFPAKPLAGTSITAAVQGYPIVVGAGGSGGSAGAGNGGTSGANSSFSTITSAGGGFSGQGCMPVPAGRNASPGGSGGGGGNSSGQPADNRGTGNTPPVSPSQGNNGGYGRGYPTNPAPGNDNTGSGGGGGALVGGGCGGNNPTNPTDGGGRGGDGGGFPSGFGTSGQSTGGFYYFAGGGGGGTYHPNPAPAPGGPGGLGGGGVGKAGNASPNLGAPGTVNTGGGAGSPGGACSPTSNKAGTNGGSGIVIIRYKFQ
jgi:hypothetical protein